MTAVATDPFEAHLASWRAQEPEMEFAEPFVPAALRPAVRAWGALLAELERSQFTPSDPNVAAQRLAWWHDELGTATPQHPVARALSAAGLAPGTASALAGAGVLLAQGEPATDVDAAIGRWSDYADAVLRVEQALFGGAPGPGAGTTVAVGILVRWAPRAGELALLRDYLPLALQARHPRSSEDPAAAAALAADLAAALPGQPDGLGRLPLYRALRWRFDRCRRDALVAGRTPQPRQPILGPLRATWLAWRTARAALR